MKVIDNLDLTSYNSYRIKASCVKAFFPESEAELVTLLRDSTSIPKIIIGNGNNIILSKEFYDEWFIIFNGTFDRIEVKNKTMSALAGATMLHLSNMALAHSLSGLEIFYDIPSSIGGAVVMNAGASGEEIKDILTKVRYLDLVDMLIKEIKRDDIGFEYRNSFFQRNSDKIVLKAWVHLNSGKPEQIREKMERTKGERWRKQPRDFPNCGSVFKRPQGYYVGTMIEELGLKGYSIGGAQISEKHGGFIINKNNASGRDILQLIKIVKRSVKKKYGVDLEIEQRII